MPWPAGTTVIVKTMGRKRGVIVDAGAKGRYRVRIESVTLWCREEDLAATDQAAEPRKVKRSTPSLQPADDGEAAPPGHVDLHGLVVDDALARVDEAINTTLLRGAERLDI